MKCIINGSFISDQFYHPSVCSVDILEQQYQLKDGLKTMRQSFKLRKVYRESVVPEKRLNVLNFYSWCALDWSLTWFWNEKMIYTQTFMYLDDQPDDAVWKCAKSLEAKKITSCSDFRNTSNRWNRIKINAESNDVCVCACVCVCIRLDKILIQIQSMSILQLR